MITFKQVTEAEFKAVIDAAGQEWSQQGGIQAHFDFPMKTYSSPEGDIIGMVNVETVPPVFEVPE